MINSLNFHFRILNVLNIISKNTKKLLAPKVPTICLDVYSQTIK